ncbi:DUF445 domain-containing protein [Clostridium lacusfryxellense]|uniref:DUF445 domain-containing protein n=1 Tax=Clostridium lacusfryxellense TaxID=205328 RepID=UPI001C0C7709|nr:DUF445 domain-containing protein [Clostridium lacusfryxellense]MBU3110263.1 DUF445 domain-containing protein [Clostridium lacusfryxellense]
MRNKRIADWSVGVLITLVIIITFVKFSYENNTNQVIELLSFVIEAALVGAIADWFAITALFEEPFLVRKIPIIASHTAIISKNRKSIVDAVANMVQNELLSEKVLKSKIEEISIVDRLFGFVDKSVSARSDLFEKLVEYLIEKLNSLDTLQFANYLERHLKQKIETIDISPYIYKGVSFSIESEEFKKIFNITLDGVIEYINRYSTGQILEKFVNSILKKDANSLVMEKIIGLLKSVNAINTSDITKSILKQSNKLLLNLKNEEDIVRLELINQIKLLFEKVITDDGVKGDIEGLKMMLIKEISLEEFLNLIIKDVIKVITQNEIYLDTYPIDACNNIETNILEKQDIIAIITVIKNQLDICWIGIKNDNVNKKNIDQLFKEAIFKFIESKYQNVGQIVKQVLNNMDDESLNDFIKQKAGNELHGIRLNGCIVGALFGGVVFGLTHLIYDLILPNIFNIKF